MFRNLKKIHKILFDFNEENKYEIKLQENFQSFFSILKNKKLRPPSQFCDLRFASFRKIR